MDKLLGAAGGGGSDALLAVGAVAPNSELFGNKCCNLTVKQRFIGFGVCFGTGMLLSFGSTMSIANGDTTQFGVLYSIGNLVALLSTAFLVGPKRQLKNMFHKKRALATVIYLASLIGTLAVALATQNSIAVIAMLVVQFAALVWYSLSYIPFARDAVKKMVARCFK